MNKSIRLWIDQNRFLFEELVKRDFKQKYKRTVLGMGWSLLSPLLSLLIMSFVFRNFFGRSIQHYTIFMFIGTLIFSYFRESTTGGMSALVQNASIYSKVNVPKYMFLLSKNVSALINFLLTMVILFLFILSDRIPITPRFLLLLFPICCLVLFNVGIGLVLSAMFVFFRDTSYFYELFVMLLNYMSAIFYSVDDFPIQSKRLFLLNPIYCYIKYFRLIIIDGNVPSLEYHALCLFYALALVALGTIVYKKNNTKFLYYV